MRSYLPGISIAGAGHSRCVGVTFEGFVTVWKNGIFNQACNIIEQHVTE